MRCRPRRGSHRTRRSPGLSPTSHRRPGSPRDSSLTVAAFAIVSPAAASRRHVRHWSRDVGEVVRRDRVVPARGAGPAASTMRAGPDRRSRTLVPCSLSSRLGRGTRGGVLCRQRRERCWNTARLTNAEKMEVAELRRTNRQLAMKNENLKRAAAHFSRRRTFSHSSCTQDVSWPTTVETTRAEARLIAF